MQEFAHTLPGFLFFISFIFLDLYFIQELMASVCIKVALKLIVYDVMADNIFPFE